MACVCARACVGGSLLFWLGASWAPCCSPASLQAGHAFCGLRASAAAPFTALHHPVREHPANARAQTHTYIRIRARARMYRDANALPSIRIAITYTHTYTHNLCLSTYHKNIKKAHAHQTDAQISADTPK